MHRTALVWILLLLAFAGIADAWYLTASALSNTALSCDLGAALGFYAVTFVLAALLLVLHDRFLTRALYMLSIAGALASLVFLAIQFVLIKALCVYCIGSAGISFLIFFVLQDLWRKTKSNVPSV